MNRLKEFRWQPARKRQILSLALNVLIVWQSAIDAYFAFRFFLIVISKQWGAAPAGLHLPVRFGLVYSALTFGLLIILPAPQNITAQELLVLMSFIFCLAFIFIALTSRPLRVHAHWVTGGA